MNHESLRRFLKRDLATVATVIAIVVAAGQTLKVKESVYGGTSLILGSAALLATMGRPGRIRLLASCALVCGGFYWFIAELKFSTVQITKAIDVTNAAKEKADSDLDAVILQRDRATRELDELRAEDRKAARDLENRKAEIDQTELSLRNLSTSRQRLADEVDALRKEELRLRKEEEKTGEINRRIKVEADLLAARKAKEDQDKAREAAAAAAEAAEERKVKQITGAIPKFPGIAKGAALKVRGNGDVKKCRWQKDYFGDTYYLAHASSGAPVTVGDPGDVVLVTLPFEGAENSYANGLNAGGGTTMLINDKYITVSVRR
jgi:hypothetical protein